MGLFKPRYVDEGDSRVVNANTATPNPHLPDNRVSNTKYSVLTFVPMNLSEQFR